MGLKFSGLVLDHFLYNGFNLAILQSFGKSPEEMEILHISAIGFARIFAPSFTYLLVLCFCNIGEQNSNLHYLHSLHFSSQFVMKNADVTFYFQQ